MLPLESVVYLAQLRGTGSLRGGSSKCLLKHSDNARYYVCEEGGHGGKIEHELERVPVRIGENGDDVVPILRQKEYQDEDDAYCNCADITYGRLVPNA